MFLKYVRILLASSISHFSYRDKARSDAKSLHTRVEAHLAALNLPTDTISLAETELFAKHAQYLKVVFYSSLADEYSVTAPGDDSTLISPEDKARGAKLAAKLVKYGLESDLESNVVYYVLFRAVDRFFETYHRYPGKKQ